MIRKQGTPDGVKNSEKLTRVLVVDDEPFMRKIVIRQLEGLAEVTEVESVEIAEELLRSHQFDAVITDYQIRGGKNGLMLLETLDQHYPDVRRVLMSGIDVREAHSARVVDRLAHKFIMKPFKVGKLIVALDLPAKAVDDGGVAP